MAKNLRINRSIKAPTVRLIGPEGEQLGIVSLEKAFAIAQGHELDLAEVSPQSNPPVCKVLDFGKYLYRQNKVETKHKRLQKKTEVKGIRMGFKTGDHDIEVKQKQARKFLEGRNAVKVSLIFKGREAMYGHLATDKMLKFYKGLEDISTMESYPKKQGNTLLMILTPKQ